MPIISATLSALLQIDVTNEFYISPVDPVLLKPQFDGTGWFVLIVLAGLVLLALVAALVEGF
jgi:hypothetical protein